MNPVHADVLERLGNFTLHRQAPSKSDLRACYSILDRFLRGTLPEDERIKSMRAHRIRFLSKNDGEASATLVNAAGWFMKLSVTGMLATGTMFSMEAINPANDAQRDTLYFT
jgi:hypothetical protein